MAKIPNNQRQLSPLKKLDIIDIIAPGSRCDLVEVREAVRLVESWGLRVRIPKNLFSNKTAFTANTDVERWRQLKLALEAKDSKAIWCVRGGYGSLRLLPKFLKWNKKIPPPKFFLGHSDITSLHLFLNQEWNWVTYHSPLFNRLGQKVSETAKTKEIKELRELLFGIKTEFVYTGLRPLNMKARERKVVHAKVIGGNLKTYESSLGTPFHPDPRGKLLFFEEIGERGYKIDRMLEHLSQAGVFAKTKGILFGDFTDCDEADGRKLWRRALSEFAQSQKQLVYMGIRSGHGPLRLTLPFNAPSVLHCGDPARLVTESGVLSDVTFKK